MDIKKRVQRCMHTHTYILTMEYYLAVKKNDVMPFAATWMDLEIIILTEVSQTERTSIMIPLLPRI